MSYPYSLPTTGSLSFVDYLETATPYSSEISDATAQRGRLRTVLKELKKENPSARDYQVIVNVSGREFLVTTLPLIFNLRL
jgi:hypothetical protein